MLVAGAGSFIACAVIDSVPIAALCIRMGWAMPGVADTYWRFTNAGDCAVGRAVCGLDQWNVSAATLPPHFKPGDAAAERIINDAIRVCFPGAPVDCVGMGRTLRFCLASLVFHFDWMNSTISATHPLRYTPLFTDVSIVRSLAPMVQSGLPQNDGGMKPTGIRSTIMDKLELKRIKESIGELPDKLNTVVAGTLERNGIAAGQLTRGALMETLADMGLLEVVAIIRGARNQQGPDAVLPLVTAPTTGIAATAATHRPTLERRWNGKAFSVLPADFQVPRGKLRRAWEIWCCGDDSHQYPPLRRCTANDIQRNTSARKRFSDYKQMMEMITEKVKSMNLWPDDGYWPTVKEADDWFNAVKQHFKLGDKTPRGLVRRKAQLAWSTVYKQLKQQARSARRQQEADDANAMDGE